MRIRHILAWLCLFHYTFSYAQTDRSAVISGTVTTSDNKPVESVSVFLKGTSIGGMTNAEGVFTLKNVKPGTYTVVVSGINSKAEEKTVSVASGKTAEVRFMLNISAQELQEITVTGNKTNRYQNKESEFVSKMPLSKLENPQVYTSIDKSLLTDQLVFSVDDAMRNATGVQKMWESTGRAGDGGSFYNTRGFIAQSTLRNGIAGVVTSTIDAANLEKLEIIKGPSGTLFGSALTSYGGLINRVTKKPYEEMGGEISLSGGSYDLFRATLDLNTPLNKEKTLLFRLNQAYNTQATFQTVGSSKSVAVAPSLLYRPNDRLSIHFDGEFFQGWSTASQFIFFYYPAAMLRANRADQLNFDYNSSYMGPDLTMRSKSANFFGQVNYKISPAFTSSTNFTSSNSFSDGFNPYFYVVPDMRGGTADSLQRADQSTKNSRSELLEIQQNFNGDFRIGSLRNRLVIGLDFLRQNNNQNFFGGNFGKPVLLSEAASLTDFNGTAQTVLYASGGVQFTYPITTKLNMYSAYISDVLNITDNLNVLAALRVDRYENQGGKAGGDVTAYNQNALSPKFGIVYSPLKDRLSFFANYQNSFRNNGTFTAFDPSATDNLAVRNAKLEQANQIEGGVKFDLLAGKLAGTVSYYNIRVSNVLRADPAAPALAQIQDGTQLSKGVEFELTANPVDGLNLVAGFTYNNSEFTRADADVNGRRPATASSPYLANFFASYRFTGTALKGLGLGFGGNYASDNKIMNSVSQGVFILPAYTVLNASAFYDYRKIRFSAKVDNLGNEKYWIGYTTMNAQRLRSFAGSITYKF
ncbi:MAG: TonB-dependent receptor [Mucilaginibacter polytrichastri]|nr:TonB-dependent receptor [Mucilaginibacter polytrichastri]